MAFQINEISGNLPLVGIISIFATNNQAYVEISEVQRDHGQGRKVAQPVPLSIDALENLYQFMYRHKTGAKVLSGIVPPEMLYMNSDLNYYVFCAPPAVRPVFLTDGLKRKFKQRTMKYPGLIFVVNGEAVSIYVHEGDTPSLDKPIWPAPFYNINAQGELCTGDATMDFVRQAKTFTDFISAWHNVLFGNKYSHGVEGREADETDFMRQCIVKKSFNWKVFKKRFRNQKKNLENLFFA
jgi:hypothetical protein